MAMKLSKKSSFVAALAVMAAVLGATAQASWQVNLFSDIHFDPAYGKSNGYGKCTSAGDPALGKTGCDAPLSLLESVTADLSTQASDLSLYAGDWQRHGFEGSGVTAEEIFTPFAQNVMAVATSGRIASPAFAGSWGNNDVVPHDAFDTTAASQPELEKRAQLLQAGGVLTADDATTFSKCAYYTRRTGDVSVVVLQTLIWSNILLPGVPAGDSDPCGQFAFLESEIAQAKSAGLKVLVVGHVPPVLDAYTVLSRGAFTNETEDMFWKKSFQDRYEGIIAANKDTVKLQIFGHTHLFNLFAFTNVGVPSIILPAITPLFGNTAAYLVGTFSDTWDLQELHMRHLQGSQWVSGMDVKGALGLQNGFHDMAGVQTALYDLHGNERMWNNYMLLHSGGQLSSGVYPGGSCNAFCRMVSTCMMVNSSYADIKQCVEKLSTAPPVDVNLNGSIVTIVLMLGVVIAVAAILVLYQIIPKIRSGEMKFSKFDIDLRAQLLNETPKKEKARRKAAAEERRAALYREEATRNEQSGAAAATSQPSREGGDEEMVNVQFTTTEENDTERIDFADDHHRVPRE